MVAIKTIGRIIRITLLIVLSPTASISQQWFSVGLEGEAIYRLMMPSSSQNLLAATAPSFSQNRTGKLYQIDPGQELIVSRDSVHALDLAGDDDLLFIAAGLNAGLVPGLLRSTDQGETWWFSDSGITIYPDMAVTAVAIHPVNSDTVLAGTGGLHGGALYRSADRGSTWQLLAEDSIIGGSVTEIAFNPTQPTIFYIGVAGFANLMRTRNSGNSFEVILNDIPGSVTDISINPTNPDELYVSLWQGGVHFSDSGGESWDQVGEETLSNLVSCVSHNLLEPEVVIIGTAEGLYEWHTTNQSLALISGELPNSIILSIAWDFGQNILYCGTDDGVFARSFSSSTRQGNSLGANPRAKLLRAFPNPSNGSMQVIVELDQQTTIGLSLFDILGAQIGTYAEQAGIQGENILDVSYGNSIPSGQYFIKCVIDDQIIVKKISILR
ncbi:MAG: T9SS type A sorting domain-containing protein [FCB group bacterium]|nr:T9SS type A sorting domain-containing protein [FCB group bacterium]